MSFNFKRFLPHTIALVLFAIVTLVYFKPLLSGKELQQHDIAMHKGMSKEIADYREKYDAEPLWTNSMFGGMPAYQISTKYPGNWLGFLDGTTEHSGLFKLFLPRPGAYLFLLCLGFFILLLCFEVDPWLALIGALAYGLSTYFLSIIQAGHNSKANALGYLPALIGGVVLLFRGKHWLGLSVTALFTALELNANHVQIAYYGYMTIGFLLVGYAVLAFNQKTWPAFFKSLMFFLVATFIGILPNAGNLMTTNEYGKLSNRGKAELSINPDMSSNKAVLSGGLDKDYATHWSYGVGETFSFLIPSFKGGGNKAIGQVDVDALKKVSPDMREMVSNSDVYFGEQPGLSAPDYIGAIVIFLALLGMFVIRNPLKWPLFLVCLLTIALGWGHNFMGLTSFFMDYVPGYNKFRAVSMIMIVPELILPLLAMMGLHELLKLKSWDEKIKVLKREVSAKRLILFTGLFVGGFCLISYLLPDMVNTFHSRFEEEKMVQRFVKGGYPEDQAKQGVAEFMPQIEVARKAIFRSDALRSLIFILLGLGALYLYFTKRIQRHLLYASLGFFIFVDLWSVDRRYLNDKSFVSKSENQEYISGKTPADEEILRDKDPDYRVLNLSVGPFDDASTSFYHKSIGGYHGAKLRRYVDLIDFHLRPEINTFYKNIGTAAQNDSALNAVFAELKVLNMLNTKYLIVPAGEEGRTLIPLKNPQANGHAWFVKSVKLVQSADSEIVGLKRLDTKSEAIMNEKFKEKLGLKNEYSANGSIRLLNYKANELEYATESSEPQFAVFSEIYYEKGWNAYVDGVIKPHAQVNYVLRGMELPAGKHTIVFKFEPKTYYTGNGIALAGSVLLILSIGLGVFLHRRNNVIVS
ncbi:MAG: YfhO family protein [Bacteroidia bacterium]|nr:YfhO family protein [Bacteroidia bacterium]